MSKYLFITNKLQVRNFTNNDLESFYDMVSNPNVMRYIKKELNYEESKKELERFISYYDDANIYFQLWAVEKTTSQEVIGLCGVYLNDKSEHEIAYRLRESFWGNGYGKEIAKGLLQYCFEELDIEELIAYVIKGNEGSIRILEREMDFVEEFISQKENIIERKYQLTKINWTVTQQSQK